MSPKQVIRVQLHLDTYIAHPYWPARADLIDIHKCSGMNRCKSDEKREQALKGHLKKIGLTMEEYQRLVTQSERQWYRQDDEDQSSLIIVPRHQLAGCCVEAVTRAPAAIRGKYKPDSFRALVQVSDFVTEKSKADCVFDRYVKLETSNQRNRQVNEVIQAFDCTGELAVKPDTKLEPLRHLIEYAVEEVGIGACRKMGYGRGRVVAFEELDVHSPLQC